MDQNIWVFQRGGKLLACTLVCIVFFRGVFHRDLGSKLRGCCRVTLHKKDSLPKFLEPVNYPLLENENEYVSSPSQAVVENELQVSQNLGAFKTQIASLNPCTLGP